MLKLSRRLLSTLYLMALPLFAVEQSKVEFLGHQSILYKTQGQAIFIDSVYAHHPEWEGLVYDGLAKKELMQKVSATSQSVKNTLLLATHVHRDHFNPQIVGELLDKNQVMRAAGNKQVIESVKESFVNEHKIRERLVDINAQEKLVLGDKVTIHPITTTHPNEAYQWVNNTAYLVDDGQQTLLHLGDAANDKVLSESLAQVTDNVDIVIAPVWFMLDVDALKQFQSKFKVKTLYLAHFAKSKKDRIAGFIKHHKLNVTLPNFE